jgi:hypothetical protein
MLACLMDIETEDLAMIVQIKFCCCTKTDIIIKGYMVFSCVFWSLLLASPAFFLGFLFDLKIEVMFL